MLAKIGKTKIDHFAPESAPSITRVTNRILYYILHMVYQFRQGCMNISKVIKHFVILAVKICTAKKKHVCNLIYTLPGVFMVVFIVA